jgi:ATP-binding cassette subfamily B protein
MARINKKINFNNQLLNDFRKAVLWSCRLTWQASPKLLSTIVGCFLLEAFIPVASTGAIGVLVSKLKDSSEQSIVGTEGLALWLGLAIGLLTVEFLLKEIRTFSRHRLIDETGVNLQKQLYQHTSRMDLSFFEESETLNRLFRATSGGGNGAYGPIQSALAGSSGILQAVSLFGLMVYLQPLMALILLLAGIPLVVVRSFSAVEKYKLDIKTTQRKRLGQYYTSQLAAANSISSTKLLNLAGEMIDRFETTARSIIKEKRKILEKIAIRLGFIVVLYLGVMLSVIGWLTFRFSHGMLEAGVLVAFILAAVRALRSNAQISNSIATGAESALAIIPVLEFLAMEPSLSDTGGLSPELLRGDLSIEDVHFSYPRGHAPVLRGLSLHIPAGQKIAIVGRNGAGKSTLIKLISRLYDTNDGTILLDGHNVKDLSLRWLYAHIAMVFQVANQFEASVQDNIAFGDWQKLKDNPDKVRDLAEKIGLVDFVKELPNGFDTHLGRMFGEVTLSIGQWQLLAISRALAREDSILILDEPTSSLDAKAEASMFHAIKNLAGSRTVIFVSHKISTVREADRILVLDSGQLVEDGTHEELIAKNGYYTSMIKLQEKEAYLK